MTDRNENVGVIVTQQSIVRMHRKCQQLKYHQK